MVKRINNISLRIKRMTQIMFCIKLMRYFSFGYSFLSFLFWFLNCFEVDWLYLFNWLFIVPYVIVNKFYAPEGVSVDFTLAIIGAIVLIAGLIFDAIVGNMTKKIYDLEDEQQHQMQLKREKQRKNMMAKKASQARMKQNISAEESRLIFLTAPQIHRIKSNKNERELTFQELEQWKQSVNKKLIENMSYSKPIQKGYYRKNLFLVYKDFNYVDDFIYYIRPTIDTIILEFNKYGIDIQFNFVLSANGHFSIGILEFVMSSLIPTVKWFLPFVELLLMTAIAWSSVNSLPPKP